MDSPILDYLRIRRSVGAPQLVEPGPDAETLRDILTIAARVPDHGKLAPWRFVIYDRNARIKAVAALSDLAEAEEDEKQRTLLKEKAKQFAEAPLVVGVFSAPIMDHPKIPLWEQQLSVGAVCLNLLHAANSHGFGSTWLTGWYAYDEVAARYLGAQDGEKVAGFIHIGTRTMRPSDRDRPDMDKLISVWQG
ncbi:Nitroreductase [Faunimonas pinastri]|uniref:Putative NAD(P)H nitroreductase n=1 Tax=Faunimonas pinastri TaxID=1855383 RepID=A0A1H9D9R1_9HYPH|nr:nitroreductase [Faunimonas pinastri]SEQ10210.1 Nitroreductase [Faunimonas pinastri]